MTTKKSTITIDGVTYSSQLAAAHALNIGKSTIGRWATCPETMDEQWHAYCRTRNMWTIRIDDRTTVDTIHRLQQKFPKTPVTHMIRHALRLLEESLQ